MAKTKPDRLTLFLANKDPDKDMYVKMTQQTGIPFRVIPAEDGPILWERHETKGRSSPMHYGPTAVKYCLERLAG